VFHSGHAGRDGLHLKGELLPWSRLRAAIQRQRAGVVIGFVDACYSGAILTPKGFVRGPPLKVSLAPLGPGGRC